MRLDIFKSKGSQRALECPEIGRNRIDIWTTFRARLSQKSLFRWNGYIKDYDGGTLMECYIHPNFDYLNGPATLAKQRSFVYHLLKSRTASKEVSIVLKDKFNHVEDYPLIQFNFNLSSGLLDFLCFTLVNLLAMYSR